MTSIIYDFPAIASALKGDDWFTPTKSEPVKVSWCEIARISNANTTVLKPKRGGTCHLTAPRDGANPKAYA